MSRYSIQLQSRMLAGPINLSVLMPTPPMGECPTAFYGQRRKYPVLWLLHGGGGNHSDWLEHTNVARYIRGRELIAVIPDGLNSDFANHPEFADGFQYCDFFFDELMPMVQHWFPASENPKDHYLCGFSMGGAATWMYGLLHPERFGGLAPLSSPPRNYDALEPVRHLDSAAFRAQALADRTAFPSGYGNPNGGILLKEINMIAKYETVGDFLDSCECTYHRFLDACRERRELPPIYALSGESDQGSEKLRVFAGMAEQAGAKNLQVEITEGGHDFAFWDQAVQKVLEHFAL